MTLYSKTVTILGRNLDYLINLLKKKKIDFYDIKKESVSSLTLTVDYKSYKSFVKIIKRLGYKYKEVKNNGILKPYYFMINNLGVLIGFIVFLTCIIIGNTLTFTTTIKGSGEIYDKQIEKVLLLNGVKGIEKIDKATISKIKKDVLKIKGISHVNIYKEGYYLIIDVEKANEDTFIYDPTPAPITSTVSGEIVSIIAVKGNAVKKVGERVEVGDILIDNKMYVKEEEVLVKALGYIKILVTKTLSTTLEDEERELTLFLSQLDDKEYEIERGLPNGNTVENKIKYFEFIS